MRPENRSPSHRLTPSAWIATLFEESGATDRLLSQLALLTGRDPARLARAVGLVARTEAA